MSGIEIKRVRTVFDPAPVDCYSCSPIGKRLGDPIGRSGGRAIMRTITSSGTLTDTIIEGYTSEVIFGIQLFEPGAKPDLAEVGFVRRDGRDIPNG